MATCFFQAVLQVSTLLLAEETSIVQSSTICVKQCCMILLECSPCHSAHVKAALRTNGLQQLLSKYPFLEQFLGFRPTSTSICVSAPRKAMMFVPGKTSTENINIMARFHIIFTFANLQPFQIRLIGHNLVSFLRQCPQSAED